MAGMNQQPLARRQLLLHDFAGEIEPNGAGAGKRGAKATWPCPSAVKSVTKKLPPAKLRFRPARKPPPVLVSMRTASFIQAMQLVWL
jgi:hypothetical protein